MLRFVRHRSCFAALLMLGACAAPAARFEAEAESSGLRRSTIEGAGYRHAVFGKGAPPADILRIYLEGDGSPYVGKAIAVDPTPQRSLTLALLAQDEGPAILLGRPCYHGETAGASCSDAVWTTSRYGEAVVTSMAAATQRLIAEWKSRSVIWIGHSGGGTLAMLLAPRVAQTQALVTIGGNLDVAACAAYAGEYLPGSLDPATAPSLPSEIRQYHYVGAQDLVVPPTFTTAALRDTVGSLTSISGFDHVCCWASLWPAILTRLQAEAPQDQHRD